MGSALVFVPGAAASATRPVNSEQPAAVKRSLSERKKVGPSRSSRETHFEAPQFTRIMAKNFPGYTLWEVDRAINEVFSEQKLEELDITMLKKMIQDKLEVNEIFMSDEDDGSEEECLICTEHLVTGLRTLTS